MDFRQQAIERMKRRGTKKVQWSLVDRTVSFSKIPATAARNWDGTPAGSGNNPQQEVLQQMVWRDGAITRYTNFW